MQHKLLLTLTAAAALLGGCDEPEAIPAYIRIEPFVVNAEGGAGWQKITDGWLYVNGELLGAYTLPAEVPVLAEGSSAVQIFPGVKVNGVTSTPGVYPFFRRYAAELDLKPAEMVTVTPTLTYSPDAKYPWTLDEGSFDSGASVVFENRDGDTGNTFEVTTEGSFAGKSLRMRIDTAHAILEIASEAVALPNTGDRQIWLEMHYRCDVEFSFFLLGQTGSQSETNIAIYQFDPTDDNGWNKIYFSLTDYVTTLREEKYRLYFRTSLPRNSSGAYSQNTGTVQLDNIRMIHF
jgi:hypothetical protein